MEAIRLHAFGPPENLVLDRVPDPVPGHGQVLIEVRAHGVHLLDTTLRRGEAGGPLGLPALPTIPGREVGGTVIGVGDDVDPAWTGRRVAAHLGATASGGGYARLAVAPVESLHPVPDELDEADAVAMIGTGRMAAYTLEIAALRDDDIVVVTAAAGGLGSLFVQAALMAGARVVALVGGPEKVRALESVAPDTERLTIVDYRANGWESAARSTFGPHVHGATIVLDGIGGDLGAAAAALLTPGGRLVVFGWASGSANPLAEPERAAAAGIEVRPVVGPGAPNPGDMRRYQERALALASAGTWRVLTHRVPLADAARAHRELEERRTTGKVVLV